MPAAGLSAGEFEAQSLADWRDDALAMIDRSPPGPVVLVGSSMGGWLMLLCALARPDRVAGLVGIAAAPDFSNWGFSEAQKLTILREGRLEEPNPHGDKPHVTTRIFWESAEALCLTHSPIAIACPIRLLHGQADPDVNFAWSLEIARLVRSADVQTHPGQAWRPPPVARAGSRASGRHREAADGPPVILLALLALQAGPILPSSPDPMPPLRSAPSVQAAPPPPAPPVSADPAVEARYRACIEQIRTNAEAAVAAADAWRAEGGGAPARLCLGLALSTLERWPQAATAFEQAAREAETARDAAPRRFLGPGRQCLARRGRQCKGAAGLRCSARCRKRRSRSARRGPSGSCPGLCRKGTIPPPRAGISTVALRLVPTNPFAWYLSAALARRENDAARAGTDIARARQLAPDNPDILLFAGTMAGQAGNMAEAEQLYRRVVQLAPDSEAGRAARDSLATMREVEVPAPTAPAPAPAPAQPQAASPPRSS